MATYQVITGHKGKWWWIEIPGVPGGFSQAKTYREVEGMAREVIALLRDVEPDSFTVEISIDGEENELIHQVEQLDAAAKDAKAAAMMCKRAAVQQLTKKNIPVRDIAALLHVSPGYISQLSK